MIQCSINTDVLYIIILYTNHLCRRLRKQEKLIFLPPAVNRVLKYTIVRVNV